MTIAPSRRHIQQRSPLPIELTAAETAWLLDIRLAECLRRAHRGLIPFRETAPGRYRFRLDHVLASAIVAERKAVAS